MTTLTPEQLQQKLEQNEAELANLRQYGMVCTPERRAALLRLTTTGHEVLARERAADPNAPTISGLDPERRRQLLGADSAGRVLLRQEERQRQGR